MRQYSALARPKLAEQCDEQLRVGCDHAFYYLIRIIYIKFIIDHSSIVPTWRLIADAWLELSIQNCQPSYEYTMRNSLWLSADFRNGTLFQYFLIFICLAQKILIHPAPLFSPLLPTPQWCTSYRM